MTYGNVSAGGHRSRRRGGIETLGEQAAAGFRPGGGNMVWFSRARILPAVALILIAAEPLDAIAKPISMVLLGQTATLDIRPDPDMPGPRPVEAMLKFLPADLAAATGGPAGLDAALAEVEERAWAAQFQYEDAVKALLTARMRQTPRANENIVEEEIIESLRNGRGSSSAAVSQRLHDQHAALVLVARGLRRALKKPENPIAMHFTVPDMSKELVRSYEVQGFKAIEAYRGFRIIKAAFRSGDPALVARTVSFPLKLNGAPLRAVQNAGQLRQAMPYLMDPKIRKVVAAQSFEELFLRDQGAMFGQGEVWMGPSFPMFQIKSVNFGS